MPDAADSTDKKRAVKANAIERPAKLEVDDAAIHSEVVAAGVSTVAVPTIVREPVAPVNLDPWLPQVEGIVAMDAPKPARAKPRGRGFPASLPITISSLDTFAASPALVLDHGTAPLLHSNSIGGDPPSPLAPAVLNSFDSLDFDDNGTLAGAFYIPPDPHGAVGTEHVVAVVNVAVQFLSKTGSVTFEDDLADFFAALAPLTDTFDPKVIYDQFVDRYLIVTLEQTDTAFGDAADISRILLGVSDDGDPNGTWFVTSIPIVITPPTTSVPSWADYPGFAVDEEAIYITANLFGFFSFGAPFGGVRLWIVDKGEGSGGFYDGSTALATLHDPYAGGGLALTTQPAHVFCDSRSTCPTTTGTYLVSYSGITDAGSEFVQTVRVDNPITAPSFSTQLVSIGDIEDFAPAVLPDAPQSGSSELIEVNNRRALDAAWRNNRLYMTATVETGVDPLVSPATAYWWILDTTTLGAIILFDEGAIDGEDITVDANPVSTFFPSVAVNAADEVTFGFSASSSTIFPGSYYTTRKRDDAAGTNSGSAVLRTGLAAYHRDFGLPNNRWGDYSGAALDPVDQCFWVYNQHAISPEVPAMPPSPSGCNPLVDPILDCGRWGTAFGKLCIDCAGSPLTVSTQTTDLRKERASAITVTGTGDVTSSGKLTLEGQIIEFQNGFTAEGELRVFTGFCPL